MIRINLLPHREEKRKARREQFYALSGLMLAIAAGIWFVGYTAISTSIDAQEGKNRFLKSEIAALDKQIEEIKEIRQQTDALLERKRIIELLEVNRAETVHVFNELASRVPDGVYLRKLTQAGTKINLTGFAQANSRVSTLMHNLEQSPILEKADLVEIKSEVVAGKRLSAFNLNIMIKRNVEETDKNAVKDKSGKGDKV